MHRDTSFAPVHEIALVALWPHRLDDAATYFGYGDALLRTRKIPLNDPFAEIRPYRDEEVVPVVRRLLASVEFLDALAKLRLERLAEIAPWLVRPMVRYLLGREVSGVHDVASLQVIIERYLDRMVGQATAGFSTTGLAQLNPAHAHLYMSNHRDITMDPAFTNYALHSGGFDTVRIAIGDNLLTKPWVSDLMRLNKSFIVKRSVSGPRELLAASKTLAKYIRHSLQEDNASVWIAQREGRAKDGVDRTEPVIIKMLSMSRDKKTEEFGQHIGSLGIVPVAISYELDPCDAMKANELHHIAAFGGYEKGAQEDVASIAKGIAGQKGAVHVSFGTPLDATFDSPAAVAAEVDRQIIDLYCLHPTNLYAYRRLYGEDAKLPSGLLLEEGSCTEADFEARINAMPTEHQSYALGIYANAVVSKVNASNGDGEQKPPC